VEVLAKRKVVGCVSPDQVDAGRESQFSLPNVEYQITDQISLITGK